MRKIVFKPFKAWFNHKMFHPQQINTCRVLGIIHKRHGQRITEPNHQKSDGDVEFKEKYHPQNQKHLKRHRNQTDGNAYQKRTCDHFSIDKKILFWDIVLGNKMVKPTGCGVLFKEFFHTYAPIFE